MTICFLNTPMWEVAHKPFQQSLGRIHKLMPPAVAVAFTQGGSWAIEPEFVMLKITVRNCVHRYLCES